MVRGAGFEPAMRVGGSFFFFILHSTFYIPSGRAIGAVVAQQLYTLWVGGSNPSSPTIFCHLVGGVVVFKKGGLNSAVQPL